MLEKLKNQTEGRGIPTRALVAISHEVVTAVIETAQEEQANMILMGWKGYTNTKKRILGRKMDDMVRLLRKPVPAYISGPSPKWNLLEADMRKTLAAAGDCNLEILFRDVYTTSGDRTRLRRWVEMMKAIFQIG